MRGSGDFDCRTQTCPNWILITTWPAGSTGCATECTAIITGNSNMNSSNVNHVMWDGGPDLKIHFRSDGSGTYAQNINSNYHIVYRTQTYCTGSGNGVLGFQVGSTTVATNVYFINNEFHTCQNTGDQASAIYAGPGATGGYSNLVIQNNIVRQWGGEGIEANHRVTSNGLIIIGNAIHDNGYVTCGLGWACRGGIVLNAQDGNPTHGVVIANNLMWNFAASCIWNRVGGTPDPVIYNNTCYDYFNGSGTLSDTKGIIGFSDACGSGTYRNNIVVEPDSTEDPFCASPGATISYNLVETGEAGGASSQTYNASTTFVSTDENSINFLKINTGSSAYNNGTTTGAPSVYSPDYAGTSRPQGAAPDIGAFEYVAAMPSPAAWAWRRPLRWR